MNNQKEKLNSIFTEILNIRPADFNEDIAKEGTVEWDSLNHLLLINEIENQFNVSIPIDKAIKIDSFKKALAFLSQKENEFSNDKN